MGPAVPPSAASDVIVGQGAFQYRALAAWQQLPAEISLVEVVGVATDSQGNAFVFDRGQHPVIVLDRQGRFLRSWGQGVIVHAHGIHIGPDDAVYCTDDFDHTVRKFSPEGELLQTFGHSGQAADTGASTVDYRTIRRAAGPFNFPTNVAVAADGSLYVSDGYGNARVHHFDAGGRLLHSWGEPGAGPGQFHVPHGIAIDRDGVVYVADRENSRLQLFAPDGTYLREWTDIGRPCQVFIDPEQNVFVAELGYRAGMFPGNVALPHQTTGGRVSVLDRAGNLLARWGGGDDPCAVGDFFAPHDIWVDRFGDIYVSEVARSAGGNRGLVSPDCHTLQKFVRIVPGNEP